MSEEKTQETFESRARRMLLPLLAAVFGLGFTFGDVETSLWDFDVTLVESTAQAQESEGPTAKELAEKMQEFYKKTKDFKAKFNQVYTDVAAGTKKTQRGKVYFKKPGKMRWDYYKPASEERKKLLVSDGSKLWIYEYEFNQVFQQCMSSTKNQLPTSLTFLMGQGNLLETFDVSYANDSTRERPVLELVPKKPTSKYKKLEFVVDPENYQVEKTTIFDPYGNTNEVDFYNIEVNSNLPDKGFNFTPPKGARLLNPQKDCGQSSNSKGGGSDSKQANSKKSE